MRSLPSSRPRTTTLRLAWRPSRTKSAGSAMSSSAISRPLRLTRPRYWSSFGQVRRRCSRLPNSSACGVISADHLRRIAFWSHDLDETEVEHARRGIVEKSFAKGAYICHRGDRLDSWTGVTRGIIKLSTVSSSGKAVSLAGVRAGGWFGEGTLLKDEPRQYDLVALRDSSLALMNRATFFWLFENSVAFNRFLVR